jgi:hypothetical protein
MSHWIFERNITLNKYQYLFLQVTNDDVNVIDSILVFFPTYND